MSLKRMFEHSISSVFDEKSKKFCVQVLDRICTILFLGASYSRVLKKIDKILSGLSSTLFRVKDNTKFG